MKGTNISNGDGTFTCDGEDWGALYVWKNLERQTLGKMLLHVKYPDWVQMSFTWQNLPEPWLGIGIHWSTVNLIEGEAAA